MQGTKKSEDSSVSIAIVGTMRRAMKWGVVKLAERLAKRAKWHTEKSERLSRRARRMQEWSAQ